MPLTLTQLTPEVVRLVERLDATTAAKQKRMEVKALYLEPGVPLTDDLIASLKRTLAQFTAWHGMESLEISAADPADLLEALA